MYDRAFLNKTQILMITIFQEVNSVDSVEWVAIRCKDGSFIKVECVQVWLLLSFFSSALMVLLHTKAEWTVIYVIK